ncbi:hypothetical protein EV643_115212 [Kribbella sp. VKM Ac-2527]|uniref:Uncharacterized protein n=1 Tax=Kribbella caucasensis TaxID=2512215 RepID=A0A4R6K6Z2_9ACTN|nr:hypothetical protein [Kribbella sp. VKM Ac-2527]TDO44710.1 hypothetical protein EV643_115212 [Kribbella sp. VKM Ac-2527]
MSSGRSALAIGLLVLSVIGCSGNDPGDSGNTLEPPTTGVPTGEPSFEPTEPETPQPPQQKPSIMIANAPIGGNVDADGVYQCAEVNWLGKNPIPAGVSIRTGAAHLEPGGVFELDQSGCRPDNRPCTGVDWQEENFKPCYVGVRQVATGHADEPTTLILQATAICPTQAECNNLIGDQKGSQITFIPNGPPTSPPTSGGGFPSALLTADG